MANFKAIRDARGDYVVQPMTAAVSVSYRYTIIYLTITVREPITVSTPAVPVVTLEGGRVVPEAEDEAPTEVPVDEAPAPPQDEAPPPEIPAQDPPRTPVNNTPSPAPVTVSAVVDSSASNTNNFLAVHYPAYVGNNGVTSSPALHVYQVNFGEDPVWPDPDAPRIEWRFQITSVTLPGGDVVSTEGWMNVSAGAVMSLRGGNITVTEDILRSPVVYVNTLSAGASPTLVPAAENPGALKIQHWVFAEFGGYRTGEEARGWRFYCTWNNGFYKFYVRHLGITCVNNTSTRTALTPNKSDIASGALQDIGARGFSFADSPAKFYARWGNKEKRKQAGFSYNFDTFALRTDYNKLPAARDSGVMLDTYRVGIMPDIGKRHRLFAGVDNYRNGILAIQYSDAADTNTHTNIYKLGSVAGKGGYAVKFEWRIVWD